MLCSGSACNLSEGLEQLGLSDIRLVVRLMCLAAAGRTDFAATTNLSSLSYGGQGTVEFGATGLMSTSSSLAYLSAAIGSLYQVEWCCMELGTEGCCRARCLPADRENSAGNAVTAALSTRSAHVGHRCIRYKIDTRAFSY